MNKPREEKSRIIINIEDGISDQEAIELVSSVISGGKISQNSLGVEHYCWMSTWNNGLAVNTISKKKNQTTESFRVFKYKESK